LIEQHLAVLTGQSWFLAVDLLGTFAFALSGVIIAREENYSFFGCLVMALLPGVGGGLIRDIILDRSPPAMIASPVYVLLIMATVGISIVFLKTVDRLRGRSLIFFDVVAWFVQRRRRLPPKMLLGISDAVGLATFTVIGVLVAHRFDAEPLWLWGPAFAALTSSGGGIVRDVVRARADNPSLKGAFYAEISVFWGAIYSLFILFLEPMDWVTFPVVLGVTLAVMVGAFTMRMVALKRGHRAPLVSASKPFIREDW
jgi:polar amino acid transport system substrate-binding protein